MCPKKKRYADKDEPASRLGFRIFQRFYEKATSASEPKTVLEFIDSKYYIGFMKFSRFVMAKKPLAQEKYIDYVLGSGVKMDKWADTHLYEKYLSEYLRKEPASAALERTIMALDQWAVENNFDYSDFFSKVTTTEAVYMIRNGSLSPWVLCIASNSSKLTDRLENSQYDMLSTVFDMASWAFVFEKRPDDVKFVSEITTAAGL